MKGLTEIRRHITKLIASDNKETEQWLEALANNSTVGIYIVQDGMFCFANPMFQRYVGYSEEELIGLEPLNIVHPEDRDMVRRYAIKMLKGETFSPYEFRYINKNGEILWVMESVTSIQYQGRRAALASFIDTTQRKQIEEKYRQLLDDTCEGYGVTQEGKIVFANRRFCEIFGYELREVLGKPLDQFLMPDDRLVLLAPYKKVLSGEVVPEPHEVTVMKKDGTAITVESTIKLIEFDSKPAAYIIIRDITEHKRTEVVLRESEEKLRLIFESVPEGVIVCDLEGGILDINENAIQMHGFDTKNEVIGLNIVKLITTRDEVDYAKSVKRSLKAENNGFIHCTFIKKDGGEFTAMASQAVLRDADGKPKGFVVVTADITEQQRMQEQLMLTDRLASIGQLAAGIAHEINNPLTGIIGFSELLLEKGVTGEIKEDIEIIDKEAKRAANVVKGLLTFVRSKGTEKVPTDITNIIQEVLHVRSYEQRVRNIEVEAKLASNLPAIIINGAQMQQVFMNLIVNAEQAILEVRKNGTIKITTEKYGGIVKISIADDGPGITPENMKSLFTPFFTTKEVGKGTGLGLSICHGIVTEHGGRIYAESEHGKGACFTIELPIVTSAGKLSKKTRSLTSIS